MWCACLFHIEQAYGGPEEGGWWYDTGEPKPHGNIPELDARFFTNKLDATNWAKSKEIIERVEYMNQGLPQYTSVNSRGKYEMYICFGMPEAFPKEKPFYE